MSHQEPPLSGQVQAWGATSDSQWGRQAPTEQQFSLLASLILNMCNFLWTSRISSKSHLSLFMAPNVCLPIFACAQNPGRVGVNGSFKGDVGSRLIQWSLNVAFLLPTFYSLCCSPLLCTGVIGSKWWGSWKHWREGAIGVLGDSFWWSAQVFRVSLAFLENRISYCPKLTFSDITQDLCVYVC